MALETYKEEKERLEKEEQRKVSGREEPENAFTIKKILEDREMSNLFGMMSESEGKDDHELVARAISGKVDSSDLDRLAELQEKFSDKIRNAENISMEINIDMVKSMAAQHPDIKKIVGIVGSGGLVLAVHKTIREMSITDPAGFDDISRCVKEVQSYRNGEQRKLNDSVEKVCKGAGVNADQYLKALAVANPTERANAVKKLVHDNAGILKQIFTKDEGSGKLLGMQSDIDSVFAQLDQRKKDLGSALAISLRGNKDMVEALNFEMTGEPRKRELVGMNDVKNGMPADRGVRVAWEAAKKKEFADWNKVGEAEKNAFRDHFIREAKSSVDKKLIKKSRFWGSVFSFISGGWFDDFDKKSLN